MRLYEPEVVYVHLQNLLACSTFERLSTVGVEGSSVNIICKDGIERSLNTCSVQLWRQMNRRRKINNGIEYDVYIAYRSGEAPNLVEWDFKRPPEAPKTTNSRKKRPVFKVDPKLSGDRTDRRTNGFMNLMNAIRNVRKVNIFHLMK